jgi:hypothetical protein
MGLNLDDSMVSKNVMRGYRIGIPVLTFSHTQTKGNERCSITKLYDEMLDPRRQRIHSFEDPYVLFFATYLPQLSFRSNRLKG